MLPMARAQRAGTEAGAAAGVVLGSAALIPSLNSNFNSILNLNANAGPREAREVLRGVARKLTAQLSMASERRRQQQQQRALGMGMGFGAVSSGNNIVAEGPGSSRPGGAASGGVAISSGCNLAGDSLSPRPLQRSPSQRIAAARPSPAMLDQVEQLLAQAETAVHFDAFQLSAATQGHPLSSLSFFLISRAKLNALHGLQAVKLARWLRHIEGGYKAVNPYHNATHAADVLQTLHVTLHSSGMVKHYVDGLGLLACYLAAAVHDYEHQGLTNDFLVASSDPLAIRYNDKAVMENHHLAAAFAAMHQPGMDFAAGMARPDYDKMRKLMIDLVLATDMKQHFSLLGQYNASRRQLLLSPVLSATSWQQAGADACRSSSTHAVHPPLSPTALQQMMLTTGGASSPGHQLLGSGRPSVSRMQALLSARSSRSTTNGGTITAPNPVARSLVQTLSFQARARGLHGAASGHSGHLRRPSGTFAAAAAAELSPAEQLRRPSGTFAVSGPEPPADDAADARVSRPQSHCDTANSIMWSDMGHRSFQECRSAGAAAAAAAAAASASAGGTSSAPVQPRPHTACGSLRAPSGVGAPPQAGSVSALASKQLSLEQRLSTPETNHLLALLSTASTRGTANSASDAHDTAGTSGQLPQLVEVVPLDETERLLSLQIAFKCSDLGHIAEGSSVHLRWVACLEEEFFRQGDKERDAGLPISPLFDRAKPGVTKSQVGFIEVVVLPLYKAFVGSFPGAKPLLSGVMDNYKYWLRQQGKPDNVAP